jgi:hypothetical protein
MKTNRQALSILRNSTRGYIVAVVQFEDALTTPSKDIRLSDNNNVEMFAVLRRVYNTADVSTIYNHDVSSSSFNA